MTTTLSAEVKQTHCQALILKRRCPHCAELVGNDVLLHASPCPHCERVAKWSERPDADAVIAEVKQLWRSKRLLVYGVLASTALIGALLPAASSIALLIAQVMVYLMLVKATTRWFEPRRRMTTRFALKMWMVFIGLFGVAALETLTLAAGFNLILKPLLSVLSLLLFVETSMWFLRGRLRKEAAGASLQWWEWGLPAALFLGVTIAGMVASLTIFGLIAAAQGAFQWITGLIG